MIYAFLTCLAVGSVTVTHHGTGVCARWQREEVFGNKWSCDFARKNFIRAHEGFMVSACVFRRELPDPFPAR